MNPSLSNAGSLHLGTSRRLDINGLDTLDYSDARFSIGESDDSGNPFGQSTSDAGNFAVITPDISDDEYPMPLPQRIIRSLAAKELNAEALQERFSGFQSITNWSPYGSKIMFLLDLIDNIPRLRLSTEHLRLIMWVMKEAGCDDLPSLSQLRQTQQQLRNVCAIKSHQYRSSQGNFFDMLDIPQLVGRDYSNPLIAPHINPYPEDSGNYLSESWQAKKWREDAPLDQLTPVYAQGGKLYYVNELARLHDGTFVIPKRWIIRNSVLTADCWPVEWVETPGNEDNTGFHVAEGIIHVPSTAFASNYYDIVDHMHPSQYAFAAPFKSFCENMPNPLRQLPNGSEELVSSFIKPWCDDETVQLIQEQIATAYLGVEDHVTKLQTASGVKDPTAQNVIVELIRRGRELKKLLKEPGKRVEDDAVIRNQVEWLRTQPAKPFNVLFQIHGLDPHRDTPVEILHTILLGVEKYAWYTFHSSTKPDAHKTFETRLQCADIKGLDIDPVRASYVVRFRNNLIGRHFKMLMQLTVFYVHDLVSADVFSLIKAVGDLGAVLWYSEITDLELYLADLSILINNVLDAFTKLDPGRVVAKLKLHILTHLIEDIRNHGPAIRYSTEIFECYNGVFRMCSLLSNHQAPSRDIAAKMIELERFRHIACGGYWETANGAVCASEE
ncbi:hypothetical protein FRC06_007889, partial [Ceratobasidium sp. 370]